MKEHDLKKSMMAKFKATGLLPYLVTHQQQLFEIPDGFFAEIVLSDASKLREAEKLIASIQQEVEDEGSHIIPIVRAVWSVKKIEALGQSRGVSGGVKAASDFRVVLESGKREAEAFVE